MFTKLFNKQSSGSQGGSHSLKKEALIDLNPRVISHYGIPSTASRLAHDPVQQILAIGTLDGRIKVMGGDNIEGLLESPKEIPFKHLEFLQNQGLLISISNENDIQVWDLEHRYIAATLHWQSNITAFAVIQETNYMYLGDDCGLVSVLKYDARETKLLTQKFNIPANSVSEAAATSLLDYQSVVGILPQPCSGRKRVLFAYASGVIVLWDVSKDALVLIRGLNDQQIKDRAKHPTKAGNSEPKDATCKEQEGKEIVALCWASLDGSVAAVGYDDGDILLWKLLSGATISDHNAGKPANNMVKLQLSSADKRFPVIVLHWSASELHNDHGGQLFVYGGDKIGSPEVLTILSLEWSPGRDSLKTIKRTNITLEGSFADMILLPAFNVVEDTGTTSLFLLSSPGQLQFYEGHCLSELISHQDNSRTIPVNYRSTVPTTEPYLTVGMLISVHKHSRFSGIVRVCFPQMASELKKTLQANDGNTKWPLNGGVPCQRPPSRQSVIERLYVAGYKDSTVRIWDATYPMLIPLCILYPEVKGISIPGVTASISALDFCTETLNIAAGNSSGMVYLYHLAKHSIEAKLHVVSGSKSEVYDLDEENRSQLSAVFTVSTSPVCTLRHIDHGARLAVGYESGQVTVLCVKSSSVLFVIDALSSSSSPIVALSKIIFLDNCGLTEGLDESESRHSGHRKELVIALRRDALVTTLDSSNGCIISSTPEEHIVESPAVSMYILEDTKCVSEAYGETYPHTVSHDDKANTETEESSERTEGSLEGIEKSFKVQSSENLRLLVCCTELLLLYSFESLIQGNADSTFEVKLERPICWTSVFKIDEERHGLLLLYQNGTIEIRSLPKLEVLGTLSLMSILRWSLKSNMDKTISSTENGQLTLINGCEFAIVSLLARENDFRIPQSLPCLHDKAMAAALNMDFSSSQKKNKETPSGLLGGMIKGLRASKKGRNTDNLEGLDSPRSSLDRIFSRSIEHPSSKPVKAAGVVELNIDDIEIDGPLRVSPKPEKSKLVDKDKKSTERKKLFEGATSETKPKQRSINEIKSKYRKNTSSDIASAASAAAEARNKLLERQEKLDRIGQNSEELRNGAEDFASMAKELAKRMENRKWWQL